MTKIPLESKALRAKTVGMLELAACLAPFVFIASLVARLATNVPFGDQWHLVPMIQRAQTDGISLDDLWAQHNEHRMVFPRLAMILLARATSWDTRYEMALSLLIALLIYAVTYLLLRHTFASLPRWVVLVFCFSASIFTFSPVQSENWLWGWQLQWFLGVLGMMVAVSVLSLTSASKPALVVVGIASASAVVGQYSLANGVLTWLICLPIFLARPHLLRWTPAWLGVGSLSTLAYLKSYQKPPGLPPLSNFLRHPGADVSYILYYLGRPIVPGELAGQIVGLALLAAFAGAGAYFLLVRRRCLGTAAPWLSIGLYALGSAAVTALGRAGFGLQQAGAGRYSTISLLFTTSTLALVTLTIVERSARQTCRPPWALAAAAACWIVVTSIFLTGYGRHIASMEAWHEAREAGRRCLLTARNPEEPCLDQLQFEGSFAFEGGQTLRRLGWGPRGIPDPAP